ncbi:hypothetical protein [Candidatus Palauibacter sp.]|uniref:hypothetical protein n=1 Tax=Candidatus Palauibacter sp. TaxID=3101350 RepID=UPI003B51829D
MELLAGLREFKVPGPVRACVPRIGVIDYTEAAARGKRYAARASRQSAEVSRSAAR